MLYLSLCWFIYFLELPFCLLEAHQVSLKQLFWILYWLNHRCPCLWVQLLIDYRLLWPFDDVMFSWFFMILEVLCIWITISSSSFYYMSLGERWLLSVLQEIRRLYRYLYGYIDSMLLFLSFGKILCLYVFSGSCKAPGQVLIAFLLFLKCGTKAYINGLSVACRFEPAFCICSIPTAKACFCHHHEEHA